MSLSRDDLNRALKVLQSLIQETEQSLDLEDCSPDVLEQLYALQSMADVIGSPLFSSLVKLRSCYNQSIEKSKLRPDPFSDHSTELKLGSDHQALAQFQQRYSIHHDIAPAPAASSGPPGKGSIVPVAPAQLPGRPSTFVGDQVFSDSPSLAKIRKASPNQMAKKEKQKHMNFFQRAIDRRKKPSSSKRVSLADLAQDKRVGNEIEDLSEKLEIDTTLVISNETSLSSTCTDSEEEAAETANADKSCTFTRVGLGSKGSLKTSNTLDTSVVYSNDTTLSVEPSVEQADDDANSPTEIECVLRSQTEKISLAGNGDVTNSEATGGMKDILYCMRHQESQEKIKQLTQVRMPREVCLRKSVTAMGGVGWDLVGLSSTGVFVSKLYSDGPALRSGVVNEGDQVLMLNDLDTGTMASFEVEMLIREAPADADMRFQLQCNPVGWLDFQKLCKK